jgi:hypothetical protein
MVFSPELVTSCYRGALGRGREQVEKPSTAVVDAEEHLARHRPLRHSISR